MSELNERAVDRLENLHHIEPLLSSLRILSLSTLQMAQNRLEALHLYKQEFEQVLTTFLAKLSDKEQAALMHPKNIGGDTVLIVLGSERGICGKYNKNLAALAANWYATQNGKPDIIVFGARMQQALKQTGTPFQYEGSLSQGSKPHFGKASQFVGFYLNKFEQGRFRSLEVLSYKRGSSSAQKADFSTLIPMASAIKPQTLSEWPPSIIEGDAAVMAKRTMENLAVISFYDLILQSISAENTIRYNLLEEAKENVQEMVEMLSIEVQIMKRQKVTQQIQEIAAGAGLTR